MDREFIELKCLLSRIGENLEVHTLTARSDVFADYVEKSLWYSSVKDKLDYDRSYTLLLGSMMVCFPEYLFLMNNENYVHLYRFSIALCYLFPERVEKANFLDALIPDHKDYDTMFEEIMLSFAEKSLNLQTKYESSDYNIISHFSHLQFLVDKGLLTKEDLKRSLDILFYYKCD